jgi:hypothetical protein
MTWRGCRRGAELYLVLFLLAVVSAPHHHLNDLEDLLLDQRSDSGLVILSGGAGEDAGSEAFRPYRLAHDVPCLACFSGDFVSAPTSAFSFVLVIACLSLQPVAPDAATPELLAVKSSSRAPPAPAEKSQG